MSYSLFLEALSVNLQLLPPHPDILHQRLEFIRHMVKQIIFPFCPWFR